MDFKCKLEQIRPTESAEVLEQQKSDREKTEAVDAIVGAIKKELMEIAKRTPANGQAFHCSTGIRFCTRNDCLGRLLLKEERKTVGGFFTQHDEWHYSVTPFGAEVWQLVKNRLKSEGIMVSEFLISFDSWPEGSGDYRIKAECLSMRSQAYALPHFDRKDKGLSEISIKFSI